MKKYKNLHEKYGLDRCDLGDAFKNKPMQWNEFYKIIVQSVENTFIILDAGAGEGQNEKLFIGKNVKYIGVDSQVGHKNWDYSKVIKGDIENLDFKEGYFNTVLLIQVMEHLKNPKKVLAELNRVMKVKGSLFMSFPQGQSIHQIPNDFFRYTPYGIKHMLEENGFEIELIVPQLYGDNVANTNRLLWSLNYFEEQSKLLYKPLHKIVKVNVLLLRRICMLLDKEYIRNINPIGYFVKARKIINNI